VVLGTRFEMRARGGELLVAVIEGRVAVTAGRESVVLGAGEMRRVRADRPPMPVPPEEIADLRSGLGLFAAYQATPLREVARELEQRFGIQVVFTDSSLAGRTLTAWFQESDLESMLSVICRVTDVGCTRSEGVLTIGR
jgi:ferric-dicitrate binding protein FerR (iron transport regulator)